MNRERQHWSSGNRRASLISLLVLFTAATIAPAQATNSIVASDNARVQSDSPDFDYNENADPYLYFRSNPRNSNYLRFDVSALDGATNIVSASLDMKVQDHNNAYAVSVFALNDGYTHATRKSETAWTSVLTANQAPAYAAWPNANSSAELTQSILTADGTITSFDLTDDLLSLLDSDTNGEITFILTMASAGTDSLYPIGVGGYDPTLNVVAEYPPGLRALDVTPDSYIVSTTNDYSAGFTYDASEATSITFDFSAFGTGAGSMDLSGCSTTIGDYLFSGFAVDPTGVTVDNGAKTITFTGGTLTNGAMTIDNAVAGTGWRIVNATSADTQPVTVTTASATNTVDLTILSAVSITALNPTNNATDVGPDTDLVATFNRNITLVNGGTITVSNLTTGARTVLTAPDYDRLSAPGDTNLTISLYAPFSVTGCTYAVLISSDALIDEYGETFAGISDTNTWRFTPVDSGYSITASDNAQVRRDSNGDYGDTDMNETANPYLYCRDNPRHSNYLRFDVSQLDGATNIVSATLDLQVEDADTYAVKVFALNDGYTDATRRSEVTWTSVLTANEAPAYATWPNANSSALLTSRVPTPYGTITSFDLTDDLLSLLDSDSNDEITFILVSASGSGTAGFYSIGTGTHSPELNVVAEYAPGLRAIDVTPGSLIASTTNDVSAGFTYTATEATSVTFDFSAFGTGAGSMDLSGCSTDTNDYTFAGFTVDPTGVTVDNGAKTITFTGGTVADGAMTIDNAVAGTGWRMVNVASADTQPVTVTTDSATNTVDLTILSPISIIALSPANNATDVSPDTDLVATFNRNITLVNGGTITITNLTTGATTVLTVPDYQLSYASSNITISLNAWYSVTGCTYAVLISSDAIEDTYGHAFAGISDTTTWRFTSVDSGSSIVASDNAYVRRDTDGSYGDTDMNESSSLAFKQNPRNTSYLRFDVSQLKGATNIVSATLDLHVIAPNSCTFNVLALNDGYTDATRKGETEWTSVLTANQAPGYATWPNANSSAILTTEPFSAAGTITHCDLTDDLLNLLANDTNDEITFILVDTTGNAAFGSVYSLTGAGTPPTLNVIAEFPAPAGTVFRFR